MAACTCADPMAVADAIKEFAKGEKAADDQLHQLHTSIHETLYGKTLKAGMDSAEGVTSAVTGGGAGSPGAPAPVRFCHWAAPEVPGWAQTLWEAAKFAASLALTYELNKLKQEIHETQRDLAEDYYNLAKDKWERYRDRFLPLEEKMLWEARTEPIRELDCDGARARAQAAVDSAFNSMQGYLERAVKKLRICVDPTQLGAMDQRRAVMLVDTENFNMQDDRWFVDYKNDQRWNRRSNLLNLGRNIPSEVLQYGEVARQAGANADQMATQLASNVMAAIGYYGSKIDTIFPSTYVSGGIPSGESATLPGLVQLSTNPASGIG